ncbi:MAG TPA: cell wall-binding repeat-containing protein [Actinomycetota bacterium]|nr:cell wall-binding repeat-containing protein [Actinomycetota bacterium]
MSLGKSISGFLAAALLCVMVPAASADSGRGMRVGRNYLLKVDPRPARARDVVGLAVDPSNPRHVVEVNQEYRDAKCEYHVSFNAGKSWTGGTLKAPEGYVQESCSPLDDGGWARLNGTVAFGSGKSVYTTFSGFEGEPTGDSILVAKSTDGGRKFARATVAIPGQVAEVEYIRPEIAVVPNPQGDTIYITAWRVAPGEGGASFGPQSVMFTSSTDGGKTFSPPVQINGPEETAREQSQPVVAPDGTIYIAYRGIVVHNFVAARQSLRLALSNDGGRTWTRRTISDERATAFSGFMPKLAVDRDGKLYVVYQAGLHGDNDVFLRSSSDAQAWSEPVRINDDAEGNRVEQNAPWLSLTPEGRIDVTWYDRRHFYPESPSTGHGGTSVAFEDVYYAYSEDGGTSFSPNRRITDRTRDLDVGVRDETNFGPFWGAQSVPVGANKVLIAWSDSRLGNADTDTQDIFLAKVDLAARGAVPVQEVGASSSSDLSVALSRLTYPGGGEEKNDAPVTKVVVVNERDTEAALAGAILARSNSGPVLVASRAGLSTAVRREIVRLNPAGAYIIGDENTLGADVEEQLKKAGIEGDAIARIAGKNPAETAVNIAAEMDPRSDQQKENNAPAFGGAVVVNPSGAGAAAGTALAAALRYPILFTNRNSMPQETKDAFETFAIPETLVVGENRDIAEATLEGLPEVTRLGGNTGNAVTIAVAKESLRRGMPKNIVYVATGKSNFDAALLGPAAARRGGIMLVGPRPGAGAARRMVATAGLVQTADRIIMSRVKRR